MEITQKKWSKQVRLLFEMTRTYIVPIGYRLIQPANLCGVCIWERFEWRKETEDGSFGAIAGACDTNAQ